MLSDTQRAESAAFLEGVRDTVLERARARDARVAVDLVEAGDVVTVRFVPAPPG